METPIKISRSFYYMLNKIYSVYSVKLLKIKGFQVRCKVFCSFDRTRYYFPDADQESC